MKKKLMLIITGLFLLTVILTACTKPKSETQNKEKEQLTIVTSFFIQCMNLQKILSVMLVRLH